MSARAARTASTISRPCQSSSRRVLSSIPSKWLHDRGEQTISHPEPTPLRKHLKDEAKHQRKERRSSDPGNASASIRRAAEWELTVGVEIHAELNTERKLFSDAPAASANGNALANSNVALFDAAMPGSQPRFQRATLLPALRAAIALGCQVQRKSGWDRKHYFHWDQPNGYQITQYYEPFAKDGSLSLGLQDGVTADDLHGADSLTVGIKQVQMEQDTAKTIHCPPSTYHVDLNRAGHPLIEIITLPQIHSPQAAAAVVRKVQSILKSVDACVTGMELGGLRADVNVSVRKRGSHGSLSYGGVTGLGQRTEIKNLSSFAAIENAIVAERDRQISILESGGVVEGETRGWTLNSSETTRLRGKEGEVDYRYMPDAELPPLLIGDDLVEHLRATLPELPDETVARLQAQYGMSLKDAKTLASLDDGDRVEFMQETVELNLARLQAPKMNRVRLGRVTGNWILHEVGGLLATSDMEWNELSVCASELADIIVNLQRKQITSRTAKQLLSTLHRLPTQASRPTVEQLIDDGNLRLRPLSEEGYIALAKSIMAESPEMVAAVRNRGQTGKIMWFVGQMVRRGVDGTVEPERAKETVEKLIGG